MSKHTLYPFFRPIDEARKLVYVSGPMTGLPDSNKKAFDEASNLLRLYGYRVCNPSETDSILGDLTHAKYLRFDFQRILETDFLVALPGWEASNGARAEILVALRIGAKVWEWEDWSDYNEIKMADLLLAMSMYEEI